LRSTARPKRSCSMWKRSAMPASSCRRRVPPRASSRSWWSNQAAWRKALVRRRPTPARSPAPTTSMTPPSDVPMQWVVLDANASAGHAPDVPVQVSATSHWPAVARQVKPAAWRSFEKSHTQRQMLMLKYGVFSTITYFMLRRWRPSIFTTVAQMLTTRKPVSRKRGMPHRTMNSSKSAPLIALHM